jgi:hypothetical protein
MTNAEAIRLVRSLYRDENGQPLVLTEGQAELFRTIAEKRIHRSNIMASTRYGKSMTIALAVLTRVSNYAEKWAVVAPSEGKAGIIMAYIISHAFDNEYTRRKLDVETGSLERLRRERSKTRLNFKHSDGNLGEVYVLSADNRNKAKAGEALMGFGAPNIVLDEASLIDDDIEAKIFRMLGDKVDNYYYKIGNPFKRNHFLKSSKDPNYAHIDIGYEQAVREGRITQEFIDEAKKKPFFEILYNNKFPPADSVDDKGWSNLITDSELDVATDTVDNWFGVKSLGVDVARGGGNFNVWVLRSANYAKILARNEDNDLMSVVGTTLRLAEDNGVEMENVFVDDTGVGAGVTDRLREQDHYINPVTLAEKAEAEEKFKNKRAENYWKLKEWLNRGGKLCKEDNWTELLDIKYRTDSSGKLQVMPKDEMRKNGIESPDIADALMLTFDRPLFDKVIQEKYYKIANEEKFDPFEII